MMYQSTKIYLKNLPHNKNKKQNAITAATYLNIFFIKHHSLSELKIYKLAGIITNTIYAKQNSTPHQSQI